MPDRDKNRPTTSEEWSDHISEFAHQWEFGSPGHCAVSDFANLQVLYGQLANEPKGALLSMNGAVNLTPENRLSLALQRIVLLEHTIEQNSSRIPGYASTYTELSYSFEKMILAASEEARTKFQDEEQKITAHVKSFYDEALDYVMSSVYDKQNPHS